MRLHLLPILSLLTLAGCKASQTTRMRPQPPAGQVWISCSKPDGDGFEMLVPKNWLLLDSKSNVEEIILSWPDIKIGTATLSIAFEEIKSDQQWDMVEPTTREGSGRGKSRPVIIGDYVGLASEESTKIPNSRISAMIAQNSNSVILKKGRRLVALLLTGNDELPLNTKQLEAMLRTMRIGPNREPIMGRVE